MFNFLNKKVILITGGTGSFGKKAVNFLLNKTKIENNNFVKR